MTTRLRVWVPFCALLVLLVGAATFTALRLEPTGGMSAFLPEADAESRALVPLVRALAESELTHTLVITVQSEPGDRASSIVAARALADALRDDPEVARVRAGPAAGMADVLYKTVFPRRFGFFSDGDDAELGDALGAVALTRRADELQRRLASARGPLVAATAQADPLLIWDDYLRRVSALGGDQIAVEGGGFVSADGWGVVFVESAHSPFAADHARALLRAVDDATPEGARIEMSGVHRHTEWSERQIRGDIVRISVVSTIGLILLVLFAWRSPRHLVLLGLPLGAGFVVASAGCLLVFGEVHGLTLAFGASLLGVCVDYPVHLFNHHHHVGDRGEESARAVWPGLLLGSATTAGGFLALAWSGLPGIREIAVFASLGVVGALVTTRWVLPPLLPDGSAARPGAQRLASRLVAGLARVRARRRALALGVGALGLLASLGIARLTWVDGPAALNALEPSILAEDEAVRARVGRAEASRVLVALGDSEEDALLANDALARRLQAPGTAAAAEVASLHALVWSASLQTRNLRALRGPGVAERVVSAYDEAGVAPAALAPFEAALRAEAPLPLRLTHFRSEPALAGLVQPFVTELSDGRVAVLTHVSDVSDADALAAAAADVDGVVWLDQSAFLASAYATARTRSLLLVGIGLILVFAMLLARHRSLRRALTAFLPALFAALATLGVLGWIGEPAHILHVVSLLLVLSIGVDYGVFLTEAHRGDASALGATLVSIGIACVSTVLAFGLLAVSPVPALRAIGVTVGVGVLIALVLAPIALATLAEAGPGEVA